MGLKKYCTLILFAIVQLAAMGQTAYWQQEVHYTIDVTLHDQDHTLDGFLKLRYVNHSPDTLSFIWFHLWPNAFKNDQTAFSEQTLRDGRSDFYFSDREQRGYINRLDFRVNNTTLKTEDHPQYIDIIKVYLPAPLAPGAETEISTPFHVKLPANFSRGGHTGHTYQVTQWYPKPAVYDRLGWHPMPYLEMGEFYSEFGSFDVRISVPDHYVVAATGELQNEDEVKWLLSEGPKEKLVVSSKKPVGKKPVARKPVASSKKPVGKKPVSRKPTPTRKSRYGNKNVTPPAEQPETKNQKPETLKTLRYTQNNIHDFAWFADSAFMVKHDTIQLASGRVVQAWSFYRSYKSRGWTNSVQHLKDAIRFRSSLIGEYPYNTVSVVEAKMGFEGGMEYPTITSISPGMDEKELDMTVEHEVGHNWFYGVLASNERDHPWMDEGINTYYDNRYKALKYPPPAQPGWMQKKLPAYPESVIVDALAKIKKDQPATSHSADLSFVNYFAMVYLKTGMLMQHLEQQLGTRRFDSCMQTYYRQWQFKHPYPNDFQQTMQTCAGKDLQPFFDTLQQKGMVAAMQHPKKIKPAFLFSMNQYDRVNYVNFMPAAGYNTYDKFMIGTAIHNYTFPAHNLQFFVAPLYATGSKKLNGIGHIGYTWRMYNGTFEKIELGVGGARFSTNENVDTNANRLYEGFYKIVPSLRFYFRHPVVSSTSSWIDFRTFFIGETNFARYAQYSYDQHYYPTATAVQNRYLNQLTFGVENDRAIYPYDYQLQVQQGEQFYRLNATGHYYFNYAKGGGMQVRLFATKFGYIGKHDFLGTYRYQPKLMASVGADDYTYSNYFLGRSEFTGLASQQIMMRDGGLKLRTDVFAEPAVRTDDWLASANFNTTLPQKLFPFKLPVRIFVDVGTYANSWKKEASVSRFLYVGGLQLSLFNDLLNIYAPVLYSKEFRDNLKTLPEENKFFKKVSFSIDVQRFSLRRITGNKMPF